LRISFRILKRLTVLSEGYYYKPEGDAITYGVRDTEEHTMIKFAATSKKTEESRLLRAFESGGLRPVRSRLLRMRQLKQAAHAMVKDRLVNVRLSASVLESLRALAAEQDLPYHTLIASVLHKFVTGRLVDRRSKTSPRQR
jgi:predicted DNA binding CopG/RHH family protein